MKKILLIESSLQTARNARMNLGKELRAIKISREEMLAFEWLSSFEKMVLKYGEHNRLKYGEEYVGYLAVYYANWLQTVVWMDGSLRKATWQDVCGSLNSEVLESQRRGEYWILEPRRTSEGRPIYGGFREMDNFQICHFARHINWLGENERLGVVPDPGRFSRTLKKKILDGAIAKAPIELNENEYFVLKTYLGEKMKDYFILLER